MLDGISDRAMYCISVIMDLEGGYVNDPNDPGGETKYGISKAAYPNVDIKNLTPEQAQFYYFRDYWTPLSCDKLSQPLDLYVFDAGVNQGIHHAKVMLQEVCHVTVDGEIGPQTLQAAAGLNPPKRYLAHRIMYYSVSKHWQEYGEGWAMRLFKLCTR